MKNLEIRTIEHKGVKVSIKIDYDHGLASIVDAHQGYDNKKWVFADRGLEFMNGWQNILEAMTVAVKECKKELEADLAAKSAFTEEQVIALLAPELKKKK